MRNELVLLVLLLLCITRSAAPAAMLVLPVFGGNSPSLDVMSLAGVLQSRCGDNIQCALELDETL
jgi:hypothetical protein